MTDGATFTKLSSVGNKDSRGVAELGAGDGIAVGTVSVSRALPVLSSFR